MIQTTSQTRTKKNLRHILDMIRFSLNRSSNHHNKGHFGHHNNHIHHTPIWCLISNSIRIHRKGHIKDVHLRRIPMDLSEVQFLLNRIPLRNSNRARPFHIHLVICVRNVTILGLNRMDHHVELVRDYSADKLRTYSTFLRWLMIGENVASWIYGYSTR